MPKPPPNKYSHAKPHLNNLGTLALPLPPPIAARTAYTVKMVFRIHISKHLALLTLFTYLDCAFL